MSNKRHVASRLLRIALAAAVIVAGTICSAQADEYRAFWVDAWGTGMHDQGEVNQLLGVVGNPNSKGDIRNANCNAVFVQVRRSADVCYPSALGEPYFSGVTPGFDAVTALCRAVHDTTGGKQRIEVHAWIVTFRTSGGSVYEAHNDPPTGSLTHLDNYWITRTSSGAETSDKAFDPGHPLVEEYISNVAMDLVTNFDIDGIHYDYIRFTGNTEGYNPTSVARFNARSGLAGQPTNTDDRWEQWRRDQVTALVRRVYAKIQAVKPWVKQSGAFVTWNPSPTASTRSAFQSTRPYYDVYSDWDSWVQEGIVDVAVPMTYYNYSSLPGDWTKWINFMKDRKGSRHMVIGPGLYLNSLTNAIGEIKQTRTASPAGNYAHGFSGCSYRVPYNGGNWATFSQVLLAQVTQTPADIPSMPWKASPTKGHISGTVTYAATGAWADGATVTISGPTSRSMVCDGTGFYAFIDVPTGTYTVTASMPGYPNAPKTVTVAIGQVTGNMYVTNFSLGDLPIPIISNVGATGITNTAATINWTTDQASTSRVEYGTTTSYGSLTPIDSTPVTSHSVALSGLMPNTTYQYRVISTSANGTATSSNYTFATVGPPVIASPPAPSTSESTATITWSTSPAADGTVYYGLTADYGSQVSDTNTNSIWHTVTITGLTESTQYHFKCVSTNAYGTCQTSDLVFSTTGDALQVVVDNTDPGWSNTSPNGNTWSLGLVTGVPRIGSNYLTYRGDGSLTESAVTRKCRWTPNLPVAGNYDVYVYYQMGPNRNTAAPYRINYNGGVLTLTQDQYRTTSNIGGWFLIGQDLPFAIGTSGYVEVTTLSTDTRLVSADAAKWVLKSEADTTAPVMTSVTDDAYTTSMTSLTASWAASDPESDITGYEYAVGSYPEAVDVKGWTSAGTATSATIGGMTLAVGGTYFVSVRAANSQGLVSYPMTSAGVTVAQPVVSIGAAKALADGIPIALPAASVTGQFGSSFYVQELTNRAAGIRIESDVTVARNQAVQVFGRLGPANDCERSLQNCKVVLGIVGPAVDPSLLNLRAVGGDSFGPYSPGVVGGSGLNTVGLLVAVAGRVSSLTPDGFYLDDGSLVEAESGNAGVRIWTGSAPSVTANQVVKVTGVVSCYIAGDGRIYARILARDIE